MLIGVLALQGAFAEHIKKLKSLNIQTVELRKAEDLLLPYDGLILPGGESTVQGKLLRQTGMYDTLKTQIEKGLPVLATCAGMILLAENITNDKKRHLQTMPITVQRNAYGRQLGSFRTVADFKALGKITMTFIRAPFIEEANEEVEILAKVDEKIVAARYKNQLALAFHPELEEDFSIYKMFLDMINSSK